MSSDSEETLGYLASVMAKIDEHGFIVQHVMGGDFPFSYTAGLTPKGLPELVCTGLPSAYGHRLLSSVIGCLSGAYPNGSGELSTSLLLDTEDGEPVTVRLHPCSNSLLAVAKRIYENVLALQVIWSDDKNRFPGDPGFWHHQPIFESP